MRKFILILALSLGGIVSAQSFDFRCMEQNSDILFDINQTDLIGTQEDLDLVAAEFAQGHQVVDGTSYYDVNHYSNQFEIGDSGVYARVTIDAEDDGQFVVATVNFNGRGGSYDTFAEALLNANAILNGGFITSEEVVLSEASFVLQSGTLIFSREYANTDHGDGTFSYTNVWIHVTDGGFQARADDGFPDTTRNTLAELIAFLDAFDFYSL